MRNKKYLLRAKTCYRGLFQPFAHVVRETLNLFNAVVAAALTGVL